MVQTSDLILLNGQLEDYFYYFGCLILPQDLKQFTDGRLHDAAMDLGCGAAVGLSFHYTPLSDTSFEEIQVRQVSAKQCHTDIQLSVCRFIIRQL
jgi:hypothetical protein